MKCGSREDGQGRRHTGPPSAWPAEQGGQGEWTCEDDSWSLSRGSGMDADGWEGHGGRACTGQVRSCTDGWDAPTETSGAGPAGWWGWPRGWLELQLSRRNRGGSQNSGWDEVTRGEDAEEKLERGGAGWGGVGRGGAGWAHPGEQGAEGFRAGEQP